MITLAGHGKDPRLVQVELPVIPNLGDRIREDSNNKAWGKQLKSLITEGEFIEPVKHYGTQYWKVRLDNGKITNFNPVDCEIVQRAEIVLVEKEVNQSLLEQSPKPKAKRKPSLPKGIKVGDMVTYLEDGTIGKVTSLSDRCINIETTDGIQSHSLELGAPKLEIHTHPNQSVVFAIGDRVTLSSKTYDVLDRFGTVATVIEKKWDKKIGCTRIKVRYEDGYIYPCVEGAGWFKPSENCEVVLVEKSTDSLPEQDFPISISGEAILGITDNFKPIEIVEDPIVDESYIKGFNVGDRIRFRDGYRTNLDYELGAATITDIDDINIKAIWDGESDSDRYTKFHIAGKQWWEKVDSMPSIEETKTPVFEEAIAKEPSKSFANLRMDEGSVSVLVEINDSVLVESDRYQFLLERREELINSGASPRGVWINSGKVPRRDFIQVVWKSDKPHEWLGGAKSRYIGKFDSDEHKSAIAQHKAGQELRKVEREIRKLRVVKS